MADQVESSRRALERQRDADRARLKEIGKERGALTRQRVAGDIDQADYEEALNQSDDEREELRTRIAKVEGALANMARGADVSHVADHVARLRAWCAATFKSDPMTLETDEVRTGLQFMCDRIEVDPETNSMTVVWSPELAMVTGQDQTTVDLKSRRRTNGHVTAFSAAL